MILRVVVTITIVVCLWGCSPSSNNSEEATGEDPAATSSEEWQVLFNGDDLSGWKVLGGDANFYVEDNMIVGLTEKGLPNCFLATQSEYDDFVLEVEFKIDSAINSGVQVRSATYERDTTTSYINGKLEEGSRDWEAGRVYSYQIEIDPSERAWTGGFYEEGGRGWLVPLRDQPKAQEAFKTGDWNHFKIQAEGNTFKTWINDVEAVQTTDEQHSKGFIALQLHGAGREEQVGQKVYYRNIKIKEL